MLSGRVKWFDAARGYGFIIPDDGGRDLFVHITAVRQAGYASLVPGTRLSYEIRPDREGNPTASASRSAIAGNDVRQAWARATCKPAIGAPWPMKMGTTRSP